MKYKVGDKVKVREDLVVGNFYKMDNSDSFSIFVLYMERYKGNITTIKNVYDTYYILENNKWNWTDEMLESIN